MPARTSWIPYALIAPSVLFLGALFLVPLVQTIVAVGFEPARACRWRTTRAWRAT